MYGWMGKILHVNLNNSEVKTTSTQPYTEQYLGGRGIASRIYWETVTPEIKSFDTENRLIFMTGPIVATGAQAANRMSVIGKSLMTLPEGYCYGNIGGFFPAELKKAGFDGVVIEGQAPKPVYLWIHDNEAELRDASLLWGQGAYRTGEMLQQAHGEKVRFITTGVAGENRVRTAVIFSSHEGASSAGFGAVMGDKNFKAVAVRGTDKPSVADPCQELDHFPEPEQVFSTPLGA
jgi:aldehyde:ferredoxin oxidoreductase